MYWLRKSTSLFAMLLIPVAVSAAEIPSGEKTTISIAAVKALPSVMELAEDQGKILVLKRISETLETQLISSINATRVFRIMERTGSGEQELSADIIDSQDTGVISSKQPSGARYLLLPRIDGFDDTSVALKQKATGRSSVSRRLFLSALVQIIDTASGTLMPDMASIQITKNDTVGNEKDGTPVYSDRVVVELAREMAQRLTAEAIGMVRPAKVLSVTGKQILINRGTEAGFEKGDLVEIYTPRKEKGDDTGEAFIHEIPVGQAIIVRIERTQSYADITGEDLGITKGAVVRKLKSATTRRTEAEMQPPDPTIPLFDAVDTSDSNQGSGEKPLKWK